MRGSLVVACVLGAVGCGGSVASESTTDAGGDSDAGADVANDIAFDALPACAPISGTSPFGVVVHGDVNLDPEAGPAYPHSIDALLLFPKGRVAGASVILVGLAYHATGGGFSTSTATLDDGLGATGLRVSAGAPCPGGIDASLVGPADGLVGRATIDLSAPADGLVPVTGSTKMCARGPIVSKATLVAPTTVWPTTAITLTSDFPIDPATASEARILADGVATPVVASAAGGLLVLAPDPVFPLSAKTIGYDLTGVRDLLGRPLDALPSVSLGVPTGAVVDRAFDSAPSPDAMAGTRTASIDAGAMWWRPPMYVSSKLVDVLGLGDPPLGAHAIDLRHRFECASGEVAARMRSIVSSDGVVQTLDTGCSPTFVDERLLLSGAPPYFLVLETDDETPAPCSYPAGLEHAPYVIDQIAFE